MRASASIEELADQRRVIRGAAGDEDDALDLRDVELDAVEDDVVVLEIDAAAQRVRDRARLLVDLLEHEVLEAALLGLHRRPVMIFGSRCVDLALEVGDRRRPSRVTVDDLALLEEDHLARLATGSR